MKENPTGSLCGMSVLLILLAAAAAGLFVLIAGADSPSPLQVLAGILITGVSCFGIAGLYKVEPNQAAVLNLFGKHIGTVKDGGLRWNSPFTARKKYRCGCATSRAASSGSTNWTAARSRSPQ